MGRNKNVKDTGFNPAQFKEERIKAALQLREDAGEWESLILEAEKHEYFKGQISCIINFSGIENYFNDHNQECNWTIEESRKFKGSFKFYTKALKELFNEDGLKPKYEDKQIFRRALLCFGEFGKWYGGKRWSFLRNKHRDYSWKRFLLEEETRKYLKSLLDNYNNSIDFLDYLDSTINKFVNTDPYYWRNILIRDINVWNHFGDDFFLCFDNDENDVYVLRYKTMGGRHSEIRTLCLMNELTNLVDCEVKYNWSESWEKFPSLNISRSTDSINLVIKYSNNSWHFSVYNSTNSQIADSLAFKLESLGFIKSETDQVFYMNTKDFPVMLINKMMSFVS